MRRRLAPGTETMVALCRHDLPGPAGRGMLAGLPAAGPWSALMEAATAHRVQGIVLGALEQLGALPPDGAARLRLLRRQAAGWELEQYRVLARLAKAGLGPVVLKGGALRYQAYPEPALRPVADLDLLLPREAIAPARAALESLGYRDQYDPDQTARYERYHFHFILRHPGGFVVELHWGLTWPRPGIHLDPAEMMASARPVTSSRLPFLAPRPEHMVVHLAAQCADDRFGRLVRIVDIDRVIRRAGGGFDWAALRAAAQGGHAHVPLGVALRLAELLLGTPVPPGFLDGLGMPRLSRLNLAVLRPVSWLLTQRGETAASAGTVMGFWLETAPGARHEMVLRLLGLRAAPMEFDDAVDVKAPRSRWIAWLPEGAKALGYQAAEWAGATAAALGLVRRGEFRFWSGGGLP